jgi:hypothetical protein
MFDWLMDLNAGIIIVIVFAFILAAAYALTTLNEKIKRWGKPPPRRWGRDD